MATRNFVPRADGEGGIGTSAKAWLNGYFDNLYVGGYTTVPYTEAITTGDGVSVGITHSLGFQYPRVTVVDSNGYLQDVDSVQYTSTTALTITLAIAINGTVIVSL